MGFGSCSVTQHTREGQILEPETSRPDGATARQGLWAYPASARPQPAARQIPLIACHATGRGAQAASKTDGKALAEEALLRASILSGSPTCLLPSNCAAQDRTDRRAMDRAHRTLTAWELQKHELGSWQVRTGTRPHLAASLGQVTR